MTARFNVTDDLNLFLGGRVVDYRVTGLNPTIRESGRFIPYVGAVYDLNDTYSVYASYTDIFMPQDSWYRDSSNKLLEPDEGQNYEIGIKGEYLDGRLNTSLAYFEIHEENRAEEDALYNSKPTNPAITYAYKGIKAKTKGYEAEISGELAPGWQVQAGYTHKIIRDDSGKKVSTWEPQDQLSLYTSYKFKGALDKLTVGGGARWQGKSLADGLQQSPQPLGKVLPGRLLAGGPDGPLPDHRQAVGQRQRQQRLRQDLLHQHRFLHLGILWRSTEPDVQHSLGLLSPAAKRTPRNAGRSASRLPHATHRRRRLSARHQMIPVQKQRARLKAGFERNGPEISARHAPGRPGSSAQTQGGR